MRPVSAMFEIQVQNWPSLNKISGKILRVHFTFDYHAQRKSNFDKAINAIKQNLPYLEMERFHGN